MGDRQNTTDSFFLAMEILNQGMQNEHVRPEIYCQIVKQLTRNPSQDSLERGWQLLSLCLDTFPAGYDLERYLEHWIRSSDHEWSERLLTMLYKTSVLGCRDTHPYLEEMESMMKAISTRIFCGDESQTHGGFAEVSSASIAGLTACEMPDMLRTAEMIEFGEDEDALKQCLWEELTDPDTGNIICLSFIVYFSNIFPHSIIITSIPMYLNGRNLKNSTNRLNHQNK